MIPAFDVQPADTMWIDSGVRTLITVKRITDASGFRKVIHFDDPLGIEHVLSYSLQQPLVISRVVPCGKPCCFRHRVDRGDPEHTYCEDHWKPFEEDVERRKPAELVWPARRRTRAA